VVRVHSKALLLAVAAFAVAASVAVRAQVIEQVLVKVNGEVFTKSDLEVRQVDALRSLGRQVDQKNFGDAELRKLLDQVTPQLLVTVVDDLILVQRGRELGYKLSDDQFKSVLDGIKKDNHLDTEEQFQAALKEANLTLPQFRLQVERTIIRDRVQQNEVFSKIAIAEDEARRYYDSHLTEFSKPPQITLRELLVNVPTTGNAINAGQDDVMRQKIMDLRTRALAGESYEKLAADFSDAPSRANAGLIGPLSVNDLSPDLRKILDQMKVGDITEPLRTPAGYQLLKLESRTQTDILPFDQARDRISERVFTDKRRVEFEKYLEKLRSQAFIDWKNQEVKKAYELGLEQIKNGVAPVPQN
jgi:peptidyl-prolyl cis-trans isomerase SurA